MAGRILSVMKPLPLIAGLVLIAATFDLGRALVTHSGVGPVEWVIGLGLIAVFAAGAMSFARQSFRVS